MITLTENEFNTLDVLERYDWPELTVAELAARFNMTQDAAGRRLIRMHHRGLLTWRHAQVNLACGTRRQRIAFLAASDLGRELYADAIDAMDQAVAS